VLRNSLLSTFNQGKASTQIMILSSGGMPPLLSSANFNIVPRNLDRGQPLTNRKLGQRLQKVRVILGLIIRPQFQTKDASSGQRVLWKSQYFPRNGSITRYLPYLGGTSTAQDNDLDDHHESMLRPEDNDVDLDGVVGAENDDSEFDSMLSYRCCQECLLLMLMMFKHKFDRWR